MSPSVIVCIRDERAGILRNAASIVRFPSIRYRGESEGGTRKRRIYQLRKFFLNVLCWMSVEIVGLIAVGKMILTSAKGDSVI